MLVYLAGPIAGLSYADATSWRHHATQRLAVKGIRTLDPMRGKEYLHGATVIEGRDVRTPPREIVGRDLNDIDRADLVLANLRVPIARPSLGTCFELGYACARGIRIVAVWPDPPHVYEHPFFIHHASTWDAFDLDHAIDHVISIYGLV